MDDLKIFANRSVDHYFNLNKNDHNRFQGIENYDTLDVVFMNIFYLKNTRTEDQLPVQYLTRESYYPFNLSNGDLKQLLFNATSWELIYFITVNVPISQEPGFSCYQWTIN